MRFFKRPAARAERSLKYEYTPLGTRSEDIELDTDEDDMGVSDVLKSAFQRAPAQDDGIGQTYDDGRAHENHELEDGPVKPAGVIVQDEGTPSGVVRAEALQTVWGKNGKFVIWAGLAMIMVIYELDNTTVYNYVNYAASSFNKVSAISTVGTACTILFAVAKPPVAKFSDVIGRGEAYCFTVSCYILGYILCASSSSFGVYAGGQVFYTVGQTGTNIMNDTIISDITSMRWRSFALSFLFFPFLIMPWVSAFITEAVIGGIGWRWGIGMFAILMPFCASFIIIPLLYFQRKAKKRHIILTRKTSIASFCSLIDLGGSFLLCAGLAMFLLPFTLAATTTNRWSTPYIDVLIALGVVTLIALVPYEAYVAKHPILPARYFKSTTIMLCGLIGAFDTMAFGATHTYLYAWSTIVHGFGPRNATFLQYTNGVWQFLVAMIVGLFISRLRRYKWFVVAGACVRFIGYGLMVRWRGASNSLAELFVVQSVQGIGDGLIIIVIIVGAQIVVPHAEMAQVTAVMLLFQFVGSSIGTAIAGGIYTGTFKERLRSRLGSGASESVIDAVFDSITNGIPPEGSVQRDAVNLAYSDVLRYISYVALGVSVLILGMAIFLPDLYLREGHNLVAAAHADTQAARTTTNEEEPETRKTASAQETK